MDGWIDTQRQMARQIGRCIHRQTDRQTDADRYIDTQTDIQTGRERQTDRQLARQMDRYTNKEDNIKYMHRQVSSSGDHPCVKKGELTFHSTHSRSQTCSINKVINLLVRRWMT